MLVIPSAVFIELCILFTLTLCLITTVTLSKTLEWKLIEVVYSICKFQICTSSNNEKSHPYSPMVAEKSHST